MLTLLINSRPAHLPLTTTIRLTRVNPYFEDQGDYTLECTLPLQGCPQNLAIFGPLHHPSQALQPYLRRHYPMQLICPPLHLHGYALITSLTPTSVKLQLVAGRSALAHAIEDTATYIDQLDLGKCWDTFSDYRFTSDPHDGDESPIYHSGRTIEEQKHVFLCSYGFPPDPDNQETIHPTQTLSQATYPTTDAVQFPILSTITTNEDGDAIANPGTLPPHIDGYAPDPDLTYRYNYLAPQPYLISIIHHVLTAAGYPKQDLSALEQSPIIPNLIIANPRQTLERASMLPHWTLSTFLTELQNLLAIVFTVNDDSTVIPKSRSTYYTQTTPIQVTLTDQTNSQSDLDQSDDATNQTTTAGSVDYSETSTFDLRLHLPDEVFQNARILQFPNLAAITTHFNHLTPEERALSDTLYIALDTHRHYAILHHPAPTAHTAPTYHLHEVDQYGPRLLTPTDPTQRTISTQLHIQPCPMQPLYPNNSNSTDLTAYSHAYPVLSVPIPITPDAAYSIDLAINPDDDSDTSTTTDQSTTTQTDTLYIAYYNPHQTTFAYTSSNYPGSTTTHTTHAPLPITIPYLTNPSTNIPAPYPSLDTTYPAAPSGPFALNHTADPTPATLANLLANQPLIDTRVEHHIPFHLPPTILPDPTLPYLIDGRLYACHKLELTLTPDGPSPLIQGYFYEIQ